MKFYVFIQQLGKSDGDLPSVNLEPPHHLSYSLPSSSVCVPSTIFPFLELDRHKYGLNSGIFPTLSLISSTHYSQILLKYDYKHKMPLSTGYYNHSGHI